MTKLLPIVALLAAMVFATSATAASGKAGFRLPSQVEATLGTGGLAGHAVTDAACAGVGQKKGLSYRHFICQVTVPDSPGLWLIHVETGANGRWVWNEVFLGYAVVGHP